MPTAIEKFHKLLAAYEDEVQRKQHKMGKKVDPRDVVEPNWSTALCSFRRGDQVIWNPSFEEIGVYTPNNGAWLWGWADPHIEPKLKTRVDEVRKQGMAWGIDVMSTEVLTLERGEAQAWELATVATAVARADAMYRLVETDHIRFIALFEGPPATRSSVSMRAVKPEQPIEVRIPANPALGRIPTAGTLARAGSGSMPALAQPRSAPFVKAAPGQLGDEPEPSAATRAEIGQRLYESVPRAQQNQIASVTLLARALPPSGPVGSVRFDLRMTLRTTTAGGAGSALGDEVPITPTASLHDTLVALWNRCRDRNTPFQFATAKLENGAQGFVTIVTLEW